MNERDDKATGWKKPLESVGTFTKYGALLIGGLCLLLYSNEIGQFPEGINLGEGLAFYLVSVGFLVFYAVYVAVSTAMGSVLLALPVRIVHRRSLNRRQQRGDGIQSLLLHTDFSPMSSGLAIGLAIVGFGALLIYAFRDLPGASLFLVMTLVQGISVAGLLIVMRRHSHLESGVLVEGVPAQDVQAKREDTSKARRFFWAWLAIAPFFLAQNRTFLVDGAFRVAQLRKDNATVHVKSPWSDRVAMSRLVHDKSFLGAEYVQFKGVNVLLRSVGAKVVIELPTDKATTKLSIPSEAIFVE